MERRWRTIESSDKKKTTLKFNGSYNEFKRIWRESNNCRRKGGLDQHCNATTMTVTITPEENIVMKVNFRV